MEPPPASSRIPLLERMTEEYLTCWRSKPLIGGSVPTIDNLLMEDNDAGCESLQLGARGLEMSGLEFDEISALGPLLVRTLNAQINGDHKRYWAWCASLAAKSQNRPSTLDPEWCNAFSDLVTLLLASTRRGPAGPDYRDWEEVSRAFVNRHVEPLISAKHAIARPMAIAVLEGLLRRKNSAYVDLKGIVISEFSIEQPNGLSKEYLVRQRLNRLDDSLRLFEQVVVADRGRSVSGLNELKAELTRLYSGLDAYDLIDDWRNELIHGERYFRNWSAAATQLLCLLLVDEYGPTRYAHCLTELRRTLQFEAEVRRHTGSGFVTGPYPPDLDR